MGRPRKLPARESVVNLYRSGMSSPKIAALYGLSSHKPVLDQLRRAGEVRMPLGRYRTAACVTCGSPVKLIHHAGNGSLYGTLCGLHWTLHRNRLGRDYQRKMRGISPERFREWQINELKPEGWKWITESKKMLRQIRRLLAHPAALPSHSEESERAPNSLAL